MRGRWNKQWWSLYNAVLGRLDDRLPVPLKRQRDEILPLSEPTYLGLTESQVRALRDRVLMHESSDACWNACREKWLEPGEVEWLKEHSRIALRGSYHPTSTES